jgi:hypothetical protein
MEKQTLLNREAPVSRPGCRDVAVGLGALSALLVSGCGSSQEAGPTLICGQNIAGGYVVPTIVDATSGNVRVTQRSSGDITSVRLTNSCQQGVRASFDPADAAEIVNQILAADGKPVAMEIRSKRRGSA